jgi:hypothetical protein
LRTYANLLAAAIERISEDGDVTSARGLTFVAEPEHSAAKTIALATSEAEAAVDETLSHIERRYGARTAGFVAKQLEYEWTESRS